MLITVQLSALRSELGQAVGSVEIILNVASPLALGKNLPPALERGLRAKHSALRPMAHVSPAPVKMVTVELAATARA